MADESVESGNLWRLVFSVEQWPPVHITVTVMAHSAENAIIVARGKLGDMLLPRVADACSLVELSR